MTPPTSSIETAHPGESAGQSDLTTPSVDPMIEVRRGANRADYDRDVIDAIIDAAMIAHVGTIRDGIPLVTPMFCVRDGDSLLLHGAPASGVIRRGASTTVSATITLLDGLVLARSAFHHSINYRSVVVIGDGERVADDDKARCLDLFVERLVPGRAEQLRPTNIKEFRGTDVLRLAISAASAKVRTGDPVEDEIDAELDIWAGVVPIMTTMGAPAAAAYVSPDTPVPAGVAALDGVVL